MTLPPYANVIFVFLDHFIYYVIIPCRIFFYYYYCFFYVRYNFVVVVVVYVKNNTLSKIKVLFFSPTKNNIIALENNIHNVTVLIISKTKN